MTELRVGAWTIKAHRDGEEAFIAEHDMYTGDSRYPVIYGATVEWVLEQIAEWEGELAGVVTGI